MRQLLDRQLKKMRAVTRLFQQRGLSAPSDLVAASGADIARDSGRDVSSIGCSSSHPSQGCICHAPAARTNTGGESN